MVAGPRVPACECAGSYRKRFCSWASKRNPMVSVSNAAVRSYPVSESVAPWKPWTANSGGTPLPSQRALLDARRLHQFQAHAVPVGERKHGCPKRSGCLSKATAIRGQAFHPERQRISGTANDAAVTWPFPCARAERRARRKTSEWCQAGLVHRRNRNDRLRIVEVDGDLHQAQAQHAGVEIDVLLRIARDGSDVMNSGIEFIAILRRGPCRVAPRSAIRCSRICDRDSSAENRSRSASSALSCVSTPPR